MKISQELSNKIANMSFVCACLVVFIHIPYSNGIVDEFVRQWVMDGVARIAVPVFFMISGFFLGQHIDEDGWYGHAITKRIKTLVIPFFALNLLWWPVKYGVHYVGIRYFGMDDSVPGMNLTAMNFLYYTGILPWGANCVVGLWYMRALFYLIIISPVITLILKKRMLTIGWLLGLVLLWCLQVSVYPSTNAFLQEKIRYEYGCRCPFFFTIGIMLSRCYALSIARWVRMAMIPIVIIALYINKVHPFGIAFCNTLYDLCIILAIAFTLWSFIPSNKWPSVLVGNAFVIFVLHGMVIYLIPVAFKAFGIWNKVFGEVGGMPLAICAIALSICVGVVVKRWFPRFATIIFGGR